METKTNPITLQDLILYDFDGKPYQTYDAVRLTPFPITEVWKAGVERVARITQPEWVFTKKNIGSLPLWYAIFERLQKSNFAEYTSLLNKIGDWCPLMTSTTIDREKGIVVHNYGTEEAFSLPCVLPETGKTYRPDSRTAYFDDVIKEEEWRIALRALFMCQDVEIIPSVLRRHEASPSIWIATTATPLLPVTLDINHSNYGIAVHPDREGTTCGIEVNEK